jgi:hypothetical protein
MRRKLRLAAIGVVVGVCLAPPSWSETRTDPAAANDAPRSVECAPSDANRRNIAVETVAAGIWKGFTRFEISCGENTGRLFFGKNGNSLRYVVMRAHEDSDAASIPSALRSVMLATLLERSFEVDGRQARYSFATSAFPEIGARLAAAAAESPRWNPKTGRPRDTTIGRFVRRLMNERRTYPELAKVFGDLGYNLRVSGTEDILVLPIARMTAAEKQFVKEDVLQGERLPVSAATYFIVEKR